MAGIEVMIVGSLYVPTRRAANYRYRYKTPPIQTMGSHESNSSKRKLGHRSLQCLIVARFSAVTRTHPYHNTTCQWCTNQMQGPPDVFAYAREGKLQLILVSSQQPGFDWNAVDADGRTMLHWAVASGQRLVYELFILNSSFLTRYWQ
jgi:hypothetical protein